MTSILALWTTVLLSAGRPVTEVTIRPDADRTDIVIAVDGKVQYRDFMMEGPYRLVVDLVGAQLALRGGDFTGINRGGVVSVTATQYSTDVVRFVLVLDGPLGYAVVPDPRGVRITLENPSGPFPPWSSSDGALRPIAAGDDPVRDPPPARPQQSQARRISISFSNTPIQDVLLSFAEYSGKSIVPGSNVTGLVTADIRNQPWDVALNTILSTQGLLAQEDAYGIIRVDNITDLNQREQVEPIVTEAIRVNYATADEMANAVRDLLTDRGHVTVGQGTNTLIVSDIPRVHEAVKQLLRDLDVRTPQVSIQAKIIFVNRTDLNDFGITYEIKDSRGNQFNELSSGLADLNGDGVIDPETETVAQGKPVVLLGGNSIAAIGNADQRLPSRTLSLLTSLVIGRHQLISFIDALSSVNLSDIQAIPQVTTVDNQQARIKVGEDIPVRTIDLGGQGAANGTFPTAQVSTEETGIILEATPHVTANGNILLELRAERSNAQLAVSDVGFIKQTQEASTRVLVQDGETVVIAGLTQTEKTEVRTGIPLLMDLPVIGRLFRVNRESQIQKDLIILVTPHIVRSNGN